MNSFLLLLAPPLYVVLTCYAVIGGWIHRKGRQQVRLSSLLLLPTVQFAAFWYCGLYFWIIFYWSFVFGDAGPYEQYARWTAASIAMSVSAIVFARLATGLINKRYLQISTWGTTLVFTLLGATLFHDFVDGIDGWTARGAAENHFAYLMEGSKFYPDHLPRRLVDETTPSLAAHNGRAYALYVGDIRAGEIHAMPYYRFWWTVSYSRTGPLELSTGERYRLLRESLEDED